MAVSPTFNTSNQFIKYRIVVEETNINTNDNNSTVNVKVQAWRTNTGYTTDGNGSCSCTIDGNQYSSSWSYQDGHAITYNSFTTLFNKDVTINHNADGSKTINVSASISHATFNTSSNGFDVALTTIPRYANITSFNVDKRDETSVTINFNVDSPIDECQYSINGGNWNNTGADINARSFVVGSLNANTTYNFKIRVKRTGATAGMYRESGNYQQSTYNYPTADAGNFLIEQPATIYLYNPLRRNITVYLIGESNITIGEYIGNADGNLTGFNDSTSVTNQYNSLPNSKEGNYYVSVIYEGTPRNSTTAKYYIDNSDNKCNPEFDTSNWSYTSDSVNLTNDDQLIINNVSTVTFSVDTPATAKLGASMRGYKYRWGFYEFDEEESIKGDGNLLKVRAIDTRNFFTESVLDISEYIIDYKQIDLPQIKAQRDNGIDADTKLSFSGTFFNDTFGEDGVQNELISAKYYVYDADTQTWSNPFPNDDSMLNSITINNNYITLSNFSIHENGTSGGFTVGKVYKLKIEIEDKITTYTFEDIKLQSGKIAKDVYQDSNGEYHTGINGLADSNYALKVNGIFGIGEEATLSINSTGRFDKTNGIGNYYFDFAGETKFAINRLGYLFGAYGRLEQHNILYSSAGSNGDIILNDDVSNYDYLEIYYFDNDNYYGSKKIKTSSGTFYTVLFATNWQSPVSAWIKGRVLEINGTSIKTRTSSGYNYYGENNLNSNTITEDNRMYISEVVGVSL